jgi:hypothetical protein
MWHFQKRAASLGVRVVFTYDTVMTGMGRRRFP